MTTPCDLVREQLDALLDGTLEPALRDHVVDCDACRDLRYEVKRAADAVHDAGGDYRHPSDFDARLMAALDARVVAETPTDGGRITLTDGSPASNPAVANAATASAPASGLPATRELAATTAATAPMTAVQPVPGSTASTDAKPIVKPAARSALPRSRAFWASAIALTAAAAAAPFLMRGGSSNTQHPTTPTNSALVAAREAWHGRVDAVARAAADPNGGIEIKRSGESAVSPLVASREIPAGAEIRTDARTRARIELADGTRLVLDRATQIRFDASVPRSANVVSGALVADVSHVDGAPVARLALPTGGVTVLGTKFALTASPDRSTVRVTRGVVHLNAPSGREVEVKTGEEGVLSAGGLPEVAPAVDLAESVAWSEFGGARPNEPDAPIVGLGELRARRPGHQDENDHQVALAAHSVRVRIVGNVARTEIDETFRNDTGNELEGIYRFPLPPEAQIEKLSLDVHGRMEDGAFVDRQRAAAIWRGVIRNAVHPITQEQQTDELVWVPGPWRDPALLEWQRGGRFELRIFPIPAHGQRRVTIAYTQTIAPSGALRRYVYPLAHDANGSTRVEQFDVDVQVLGNDAALGVRPRGYALANDPTNAAPGATHLAFSQSSFVPAGDLVLEYGLPDHASPATTWAFQPVAHDPTGVGATATTTLPAAAPNRAAHAPAPAAPAAIPPMPTTEPAFVAMALRPTLPHWTEARSRDYAIVLDASRSMVGERLARAVRLTRAMVAEMDPRDRVVVLACDTTCREMPGGLQYAGASTVRVVEQFLGNLDAAGGSDLVAQMRAALALVTRSSDRDGRVVYLGDGAATVGYRRTDQVATEVAESIPAGRTTITTVALGHDADSATLAAIARAGGGVSVPYSPGETVQSAALSVLESTFGVALRDPILTLPPGLTDVTPSRLSTLRAGGEVLVAARMSGTDVQGEAVLRGTVAGEPFEQRFPIRAHATSDAGNSFVPRLFAAQRIADLESNDAMTAREEIVGLSQRFHVPSRFTSLLVLESDAMYRAFGVRREAQNEVSWTGEQTAVASASEAPPAPPVGAVPTERSADENAEREAQRAVPTDPSLAFGTLAGGMIGGAQDADHASLGLSGTGEGGGGSGTIGAGNGTGAGYGVGAGRAGMRHAGAAGESEEDDTAGASDSIGDNSAPVTASTSITTPTVPAAPAAAAAPTPMPSMARRSRAASEPSPDLVAATRQPSGGGGTGGLATQGHASSTGGAPILNNGTMMGPVAQQNRVTARPADRVERLDRPGQWMRRTWVRRGSVNDGSARSSDLSHVITARAALQSLPDSKTRHQELYRWLSISANFDEAAEIATRWSTRDALDPDALTRLADVAARRGDRDRAIRILGGVIDVRPDDVNALKRMITLHDRAGQSTEACAYRISLAQVQSFDAAVVADALRCERALGHANSAVRMLSGVFDPSLRTRVETIAGTAAPTLANTARGEIVLDANWDVPGDLDVALIDSQGRRISWLGGRNTGITVRGARDPRSEALGLSRASVGDYQIEISRAQSDTTRVSGRVEVTVLGERRAIAFTFPPGEKTVRAGRINVTREEQLVPVSQF